MFWMREFEFEEGKVFLMVMYNMEGFESIELVFFILEEFVEKVMEFFFEYKVFVIGIVENEKGWEFFFIFFF